MLKSGDRWLYPRCLLKPHFFAINISTLTSCYLFVWRQNNTRQIDCQTRGVWHLRNLVNKRRVSRDIELIFRLFHVLKWSPDCRPRPPKKKDWLPGWFNDRNSASIFNHEARIRQCFHKDYSALYLLVRTDQFMDIDISITDFHYLGSMSDKL